MSPREKPAPLRLVPQRPVVLPATDADLGVRSVEALSDGKGLRIWLGGGR